MEEGPGPDPAHGLASKDDPFEGRTLRLALSGGGFRATLFHLGVVAYLCERGYLDKVREIASVSGGSILSAHLIDNWREYCDPASFPKAASSLLRFVKMDVRGRILREAPFAALLRLVWLPLRTLTKLRLPLLQEHQERARRCDRALTRNGRLARFIRRELLSRRSWDWPEGTPRLSILATNLRTGGGTALTSRGFVKNYPRSFEAVPAWIPLELAVAASASFPGFFAPISITNDDLARAAGPKIPNLLTLSDGGVFDNLGVRWAVLHPESDRHLNLISDATGAFAWEEPRHFRGLLGTAIRASDIMMREIRDREREWLQEHSDNTRFISIEQEQDAQQKADGKSVDIQEQLKGIRTDLDRFSDTEIHYLVAHGYRSIAREFGDNRKPSDFLEKVAPPPPAGTDVLRELRAGHDRKLRLFSFRDAYSAALARISHHRTVSA